MVTKIRVGKRELDKKDIEEDRTGFLFFYFGEVGGKKQVCSFVSPFAS